MEAAVEGSGRRIRGSLGREERSARAVIGRKNWMFAGSENGAGDAVTLFSLVFSCRLSGVDPFTCLRDILTRLPDHPADRIRELIPRQWQARFTPRTTSPAAPAVA